MILKKCTIFPIIFSLIILFSCDGNKRSNHFVDIKAYSSGSWLDNDTFRVAAEGPAPRAIKKVSERRKSAVRSATRHAQYKVLNSFKEISNKSVLKKNRSRFERKKLEKTVIKIIKNGYIVKGSVVYDKNDRCKIIYEVKAKGLKQILDYVDLAHVEVIH